MHYIKEFSEDIFWVGSDEHSKKLFENIHPIKNGVSYNSYLIKDDKNVLFDTVDWSVCRQFIENIEFVLAGEKLDYLVINHVEPDHAASIDEIILRYPEVKIICSQKAVLFMKQFGFDVESRCQIVKEGDEISFGKHTVSFIMAPMVHWPEAMVSFEKTTGILFSADAFGTFGELGGRLFFDEYENKTEVLSEYRRYYCNIVGKFGPSVQMLLKKTRDLSVKMICPLHGPIIRSDIELLLEKYNIWSSYKPEEQGVLVVYASMYGSTENAIKIFERKLVEHGILNVLICDASNTDMSNLIAESFKFSHIVIATPTYNGDMFPLIHNYISDMKALNLQNKFIGIVENGTWACTAGKCVAKAISEMKNITILENVVTILSCLSEENLLKMDSLIEEIKSTI